MKTLSQHLEGHVDVVHKKDVFLARTRSKNALAPFFALRVQEVLDLVRGRLRAEGQADGHVFEGVEAALEVAVDVHLRGASRSLKITKETTHRLL